MKHLILWIVFGYSLPLLAQPKFNLKELKARFPNDDVLFLNRSEAITISLQNGVPVIESTHQEDRLFLNERASAYAEDRIYYTDAFQEITNIEAATYVPKVNGFEKIAITDIKTERPSPSDGIFFDDMHVRKFAFKSAQMGGVGAVSYRERIKSPFMLSGTSFGNYTPMLNAEFSVTFTNDIKVSYKVFNDQKGIVFTKTTQNNRTTYRWKATNLKAYPYELNTPALSYYVPHVQLFIESYTANGQTVEILGSEQKLFKYYQNLLRNLNKTPNVVLSQLSDSLARGKSNIEKIRSVYYWVQDHVKYIAFEDGLGGFVPRQAADVCQKRYGDCKDMASLLTAMLNLVDVPAKMVWIGTRAIPYRYAENPSMGVDNHMIAAVKVNNEWVYLDATDNRIDFGPPTWHIQGKECMIRTGDDTFEIAKVPILPAQASPRRDSLVIGWQDRTLVGKGTLVMDGYTKVHTKALLQIRSDTERDEYYRTVLFKRGSNKCLVENWQVQGLQERDTPLRFEYAFNVKDYVQQVGNEVFVNPHLKRTWAEARFEPSRRVDRENDYNWVEETIVTLPIPQGYAASYIPRNVSFLNPKFGFNIAYEQLPNTIVVKTKIISETLIVKTTDFAEWNKMVAALNDAYAEVISLKKR